MRLYFSLFFNPFFRILIHDGYSSANTGEIPAGITPAVKHVVRTIITPLGILNLIQGKQPDEIAYLIQYLQTINEPTTITEYLCDRHYFELLSQCALSLGDDFYEIEALLRDLGSKYNLILRLYESNQDCNDQINNTLALIQLIQERNNEIQILQEPTNDNEQIRTTLAHLLLENMVVENRLIVHQNILALFSDYNDYSQDGAVIGFFLRYIVGQLKAGHFINIADHVITDENGYLIIEIIIADD